MRALSATGVYVQTDANTPAFKAIAANTSGTEKAPLDTKVEHVVNQTPALGAHTKASLRIIDSLPSVRVYESGYAGKLVAPTKSRKAGTGNGVGTSSKPGPHSFLLELDGRAGRKLRLQVRFRSRVSGKGVTGAARIDVGNDGSNEFDKKLDGSDYLADLPVTVDGNGKLKIKIETEALLSSSDPNASSYRAWADVSLEPIPYSVVTIERYGASCGPDLDVDSWIVSDQRHFSASLTKAPKSAPALAAVGLTKIKVPFPGTSCFLLTDPILIVAATTDKNGELEMVFPTLDAYVPLRLQGQFAVADSVGRVLTSNGVELVSKPHSGMAYDHYDRNHILSTGQSLSTGYAGGAALSTTQPFKNKAFANGLFGKPSTSTGLWVLVEASGESHHSGMANLITEMAEQELFKGIASPMNTHELLVSAAGVPGREYAKLKKGNYPYAWGVAQIESGIANSKRDKKSYVVRAVSNVHGETDHILGSKTYLADLKEWQLDYQRDVRRRTGQTQPVPMLHSQFSSWSRYNTPTSEVVLEQLRASVENPRTLVMVGPKYHFAYNTDGIHLKNIGYRHMGEQYARVYRHVILEGGTWEPLRPVSTVRNGKVIDVRFWVPEPPLRLDTTLVTDPGNYGFEFADETTTTPSISKVELVDEDTVRITLSKAPTGKKLLVRYAYTGVSGAKAGPASGPRGNLRDSDSSRSRHANPMYNWCVHFEMPVK